ncbi:MAG: site-2 protease family protein [Candidatus Diapherotrites archaeon]
MLAEIWIFLFLLAVFVSTYLLKGFAGAETFFRSFSIVRSRRLTGAILKLEWLGSFVSVVSTIGFILGFGVFATDFLYGRKRRLPARLLVAAATAACLYAFYFSMALMPVALVPFSFFKALELHPLTSQFSFHLAIAFSFFGIAGFMIAMLGISALGIIARYLVGQPSCPNVAPLLPGIQLPQMPFVIPIYAWLGIFFAMLVHEAGHGIKALHERVKVKSSGVMLLGFLPLGAFVEPDEEMLKVVGEKARIGVFSAGPSINLLSLLPLFIILLFIFAFILLPASDALEKAYVGGVDHVEISDVKATLGFCGNPPSPAYGKLEKGMRVVSVNGMEIKNTIDWQRAVMKKPFLESEFVVLDLNGLTRVVYITPHQETNSFGIEPKDILKEGFSLPEKESNDYLFAYFLYDIFNWMAIIAFLLATANFLPIPAFDGGQIAAILYAPFLAPFVKSGEKREKIVKYFFLALLLVLLAINAAPFFL